MAWQYLVVCFFDFMVGPMYWAWITHGASQWDPVTLRGGGMYHVAMGAVVGIYTWTRSQEKRLAEFEGMNGFDGYQHRERETTTRETVTSKPEEEVTEDQQ